MTSCVVYARVVGDSHDGDVALARQVAACTSHATGLGLTVDSVIEDRAAAPAGAIHPGFESLLEQIASGQGAVAVIAHRLDRLARDSADLERLLAAAEVGGVTVHTVEPPLNLSETTDALTANALTARLFEPTPAPHRGRPSRGRRRH